MTTATATALKTGTWAHPRTGEVRHYVNNWTAVCGLQISTHKSGSISSAQMDGEKISNSRAKQIISAIGKVWIDDSGVHTTGSGTDWLPASKVIEAIRNAQAEA